MRAHECTHLLLSDTTDVRYLTGFASSNVFVVLGPGSQHLCTDFRYEQAARTFCRRTPPWKLTLIREGSFVFLRDIVPRGAVLGLQSSVVTLDQMRTLRKALRGVRFSHLGSSPSDISLIKSDREVALMARCARMADRALRRTVPQLRTGITELEARDLLEQACREEGSEGPAFETIALFGPRTALPHGTPSRARLREGDYVLFDFGCTRSGFRSDMTRTFVKGRASRQQRRVYQTVLQAQQRACKRVRRGVRCATIDALARDHIESAGYGEYFGHATGHGVGYRIHENPRLSARNPWKLRSGCVVTVEPGIYIPSHGGVRIEDMVCVTETGCRVLTGFTRKLTVV